MSTNIVLNTEIMEEINRLKAKFNLRPHPEGGFFGPGYRSQEFIKSDGLHPRYKGPRNLYSSIYFMVTPDHASKFHRLQTDEMWHFYKGDPIVLHLISEGGKYATQTLTNENGKEHFQFLVRKNTWMAAECVGVHHQYALVANTLAPGFEYDDFELADRAQLMEQFPHLKLVIEQFS